MIEKLEKQFAKQGSVRFKIKVIPKSNHTEIVGAMSDGTIKLRVAAVPEKNKANTEIIKYLAKTFKVQRSQIRIITGETSPIKLIEIK